MDDVVWARRAVRNLDDIAEYIARDDPEAAQRIVRLIVERVAGLAFFPRIGREGRIAGTRELVITGTPYIVLYRISERVEVLRIRHAARRWPEQA